MRLPPPLSWIWNGWKKFSHAFGVVMSTIILSLLWIVAFGLYGIVMRIGGLFEKKQKKESEWLPLAPVTPDSFKRPF